MNDQIRPRPEGLPEGVIAIDLGDPSFHEKLDEALKKVDEVIQKIPCDHVWGPGKQIGKNYHEYCCKKCPAVKRIDSGG